MATMELKVTLSNQTQNTLQLVKHEGGPNPPASIASNQRPQLHASSSWDAISGSAVYRIDETHTVSFGWYVQLFGPNSYSCSVAPDDGQYAVSRAGSDIHCYNCDETYTVVQYY